MVAQEFAVLGERHCDLAAVLPTARALREQVDWRLVRSTVAGNSYADVTVELLERLGIIGGGKARDASPGGGT